MRTNLLATGITLLGIASAAHAAPEFIDIGGSAGYVFSDATAVSDGGTVVVGWHSIPGPPGLAAYRWSSATGAVNIEPTSAGRTWRSASAINPAGTAIAGLTHEPYSAVRWLGGTSKLMRGVPGMTASLATSVSDSGGIVVGEGQFAGGIGTPPSLIVRWFPDDLVGPGVQVLGAPAGLSTASATACSADGQTIVGAAGVPGIDTLLPFVWRETTGFELLSLPVGYARGAAFAMSRDGAFAVGTAYNTLSGSIVDCRWALATNTVSVLPRLTGSPGTAIGTSRDGSVVIGSDWVWTEAGGAIALVPFLEAQGINLAGWSELEFLAISPDASAVCGQGRRGGQYRGFVARDLRTICGPFIRKQPEPAFALASETSTFSIDAGSPAGANYFWYRLGEFSVIADGVQPGGAIVSGANTPTLTLANVSPLDADYYSCTISTGCGTASSAYVPLVVNEPCGNVTRLVPVGATCDNTSQTCSRIHTVILETAGPLSVEYIASPFHCSDVGMNFYLDGVFVASRPPVSAGGSAGPVDFGAVSPGRHEIGLGAFGTVGGCNPGTLAAWGGTLKANFLIVPPVITESPSPASVCLYTAHTFTARATAGGPPLRTWQIDDAVTGGWRTILPGTNFAATTSRPAFYASDVNSEVLTIIPFPGFFDDWPSGPAYLQSRVQNACGVVFSQQAAFGAEICCTADFNLDGFLDFSDFDMFVAAFEAGDAAADFNGDSFLDFTDFDDFVVAFETGC